MYGEVLKLIVDKYSLSVICGTTLAYIRARAYISVHGQPDKEYVSVHFNILDKEYSY